MPLRMNFSWLPKSCFCCSKLVCCWSGADRKGDESISMASSSTMSNDSWKLRPASFCSAVKVGFRNVLGWWETRNLFLLGVIVALSESLDIWGGSEGSVFTLCTTSEVPALCERELIVNKWSTPSAKSDKLPVNSIYFVGGGGCGGALSVWIMGTFLANHHQRVLRLGWGQSRG